MKIESYEFGRIKIDNKDYVKDVIIFPEEIKLWQREESHSVGLDDIKEVVNKKPNILIFGTGYSGLMEIPKKLQEYLEGLGIKVIIKPTKDASEVYNQLLENEKEGVIAMLHLTC